MYILGNRPIYTKLSTDYSPFSPHFIIFIPEMLCAGFLLLASTFAEKTVCGLLGVYFIYVTRFGRIVRYPRKQVFWLSVSFLVVFREQFYVCLRGHSYYRCLLFMLLCNHRGKSESLSKELTQEKYRCLTMFCQMLSR